MGCLYVMMAGYFNLLNQYSSEGGTTLTDDLKSQTAGVDDDQNPQDPVVATK